jgi:hypothetical protein
MSHPNRGRQYGTVERGTIVPRSGQAQQQQAHIVHAPAFLSDFCQTCLRQNSEASLQQNTVRTGSLTRKRRPFCLLSSATPTATLALIRRCRIHATRPDPLGSSAVRPAATCDASGTPSGTASGSTSSTTSDVRRLPIPDHDHVHDGHAHAHDDPADERHDPTTTTTPARSDETRAHDHACDHHGHDDPQPLGSPSPWRPRRLATPVTHGAQPEPPLGRLGRASGSAGARCDLGRLGSLPLATSDISPPVASPLL